jgi:hypothetical protein
MKVFSGTFKVILVDFAHSSGHYKALQLEVGRLCAAGDSDYCQNEYCHQPTHHSSTLEHLAVIDSSPPYL